MALVNPEFNKIYKHPTVLVAPLNWGLGHATRCIPIIRDLMNKGCVVIIAAEGVVEELLKKEFPELNFLPLPGYNIKYSRNKFWLPLKLLTQIPKILWAIYKEHNWLKKSVEKYKIDAVISDNRYGLYHSIISSIFITHQLLIKTGNSFSERIAQKINYYFIKKYKECWVPDMEGEDNFAGELSHPKKLPGNEKYIGILSRFSKTISIEKKYDLLMIISGPEPQRSVFEKIIIKEIKEFIGKVVIVRGLPNNAPIITLNKEGVHFYNHLTAQELNEMIEQSKLVVSRSGYTTIMDLIKLQQQAVLIPTPGQTEQAYLAQYLTRKKIFYCIDQDKFHLKAAIDKASQFYFNVDEIDMEQYKAAIEKLIASL